MTTYYYMPAYSYPEGKVVTLRVAWRSMTKIWREAEYRRRLGFARTPRQERQARVWYGLQKRRASRAGLPV